MRRPWFAIIYSAVVLLIAAGMAWRAIETAGNHSCPDGHCPDPGTKEAAQESAVRVEQAPALAVEVGGGIVLIGGALAAGLSVLNRRRG